MERDSIMSKMIFFFVLHAATKCQLNIITFSRNGTCAPVHVNPIHYCVALQSKNSVHSEEKKKKNRISREIFLLSTEWIVVVCWDRPHTLCEGTAKKVLFSRMHVFLDTLFFISFHFFAHTKHKNEIHIRRRTFECGTAGCVQLREVWEVLSHNRVQNNTLPTRILSQLFLFALVCIFID